MKKYFELFYTFAKMGLFTFGGGYAMLPILTREVVNNKGWATEEELLDYYAIGQSTPGIIAVNTATFIGYKNAGVVGGVLATLGVVFPSLVIIMLIASLISQFSEVVYIQYAFAGIRVAVCALVTKTVWGMAKKSVLDPLTLIIFIVTFIAVGFFKITPIAIVVLASFIGIYAKRGEA
ncbi:MAG: chromate transporter [Tissierellia bacterium]|nr:chromate transporter [Tissierellia bacterium]